MITDVRFRPIADIEGVASNRLMKLGISLSAAVLLASCSQTSPDAQKVLARCFGATAGSTSGTFKVRVEGLAVRAGTEGGQWARSAVCPEQRLHIESFSKLAAVQFQPVSSAAEAADRWVGFVGTAIVLPITSEPFHLNVQAEAFDRLRSANHPLQTSQLRP